MIKRSDRLRGMSSRRLAVTGMVLVLGILVAMVSVSVSAVVVNFPDPGLEAAIREAIGKPTGDIHDTDLVGLTDLNADNRGIVNLEGIQYCVDLTELSLNSNQISDIAPLAGLTNLTQALEDKSHKIGDLQDV